MATPQQQQHARGTRKTVQGSMPPPRNTNKQSNKPRRGGGGTWSLVVLTLLIGSYLALSLRLGGGSIQGQGSERSTNTQDNIVYNPQSHSHAHSQGTSLLASDSSSFCPPAAADVSSASNLRRDQRVLQQEGQLLRRGHSSVSRNASKEIMHHLESRVLPHMEHVDLSFLCHPPNPSISYLQIAAPPTPLLHIDPVGEASNATNFGTMNRPTILCLILTQASSHSTRLETIYRTWAKLCDGFMAASDQDDPKLGAFAIPADTGYWGIWDKVMQSLQILLEPLAADPSTLKFSSPVTARQAQLKYQVQRQWQQDKVHNPLPSYDYIFKADDDTFAIMENLHEFLHNLTLPYADSTARGQEELYENPRVYGRRMPFPKIKLLKEWGWFDGPEQQQGFGKRLYAKFPKNTTVVYPHGGPGYVMNRKYAQILTNAYFYSQDVAKGLISEDIGNAVTMMYRDIYPNSTFDVHTGRERSHPESPATMYANPKWLPWVQEKIQHRGTGKKCCSPSSISFHHVNHREMQLLWYQLYTCPSSSRM